MAVDGQFGETLYPLMVSICFLCIMFLWVFFPLFQLLIKLKLSIYTFICFSLLMAKNERSDDIKELPKIDLFRF